MWTFDPQQIAFAEQTWWWDPLRAIRDADPPARVDAAARLAGHFLATLRRPASDPFFHAAGEQVLTGTLLAAAVSGGTLRDVVGWLQDGRRDAITALDTAGAHIEAADLEATLGGADVTTKGIFQTARTATKALTSERILRWITPPHTWRTPPPPGRCSSNSTSGNSSPAPTTPPTTPRAASQRRSGRRWGRRRCTCCPRRAPAPPPRSSPRWSTGSSRSPNSPPKPAAAASTHPWSPSSTRPRTSAPSSALPQLYSHFGCRGIQVLTMLQSYQQGVGVWGTQGMDALWSAATVKLVGAGVDDHPFLQRLSGLIGDHDVEKISTSHARGRGGSRQYSTTREPVLPVSTCAPCPRPTPSCSPPAAAPGSASSCPGTANPTTPPAHRRRHHHQRRRRPRRTPPRRGAALGPTNPVAAALRDDQPGGGR